MPTSIAPTAMVPPGGLHSSVDTAMSALGGLDSQGFLNLLVAQLRYQSPMEPSDPGDLMTQTAALAQLDVSQQLLKAQQHGLGLQQAVGAAGMLGQTITAYAQDGTSLTGTVDAVRYTSYGPVLEVNGIDVPYEAVGEVRRGGAAVPPTAPPPPADGEATPDAGGTAPIADPSDVPAATDQA